MKGIGIGIVRWLVGLIFGIVAAALLFGLAARVASAQDVIAGESFSLLVAGFGVAFFPAVFAAGTRSPRNVARRGLVGIAIEGIIALVLGAYQLIAHSALVPPSAFGWLGSVKQAADSLANIFANDTLVAVLGLVVFAVSLLLAIALRTSGTATQAAQSAPTRAIASPARADTSISRPPAIPQARPVTPATSTPPPANTAAKTDDEDAQLMADLDNLRKRLPKMGVDDSGSGGKS